MAAEAPTVAQLLGVYADAMAALRNRGVTRSANSPVADYAEHLAAWHYNGTLQPQSSLGYDVRAADDARIQVKAMWKLARTRTSLSALRGLERHAFDLLLAVVFAADLRSWDGYEFEYDLVREKAAWSGTWSAHRLSLSARLLSDPRVRRIELEAPPESYWLGAGQ